MPFVIYVFTISAFALGLAEFVPIGLTDVMAQGLCVGVEQTGAAVTTYALGATFAAPVLSALTASWSRKNVMLTTAVVFTAGSLAAAFAATLPQLLLARFIAGLGHGLFLAAASSTAARLAGPGKAGRAVAVVFGGFTLAMAIGVPLSTWLGGVVSWRPVLGAIAAFGAFGFLGLLFGMKDPVRSVPGEHSDSAMQNIGMLFNRKLLAGALVTVLAYAGSFTAYTFIAPILTQVTGVMPDDRLYGYAHLLTERMLLVHAPAMSEIIGSEPGAETLASLPLIAYDEELPLIRALWASMFQRAPEMQATFTIPDLRIIRDLVCDGHGWTVLPDYHCDNDLKSGRLISVTPADLAPTNHLYLVWNKRTANNSRTAYVRDYILKTFPR
ncbi:MFS transporter [Escherichia coli]|uniref:MFS transporter n=9 Tax=Escherichia coli TaxID=562 RepID=UPI00118541E9|nr:MFS transporter [Escherichia coli]TSB57401.1 MFS transporter [Escherichia coli]